MAVAKAKKVRSENKDRMHFRLAPDIKARVARAASITGQGLTDFAISALSERADKILGQHDTVLLDAEAYGSFSNRSTTAANLRRRRAPLLLVIGAVNGKA